MKVGILTFHHALNCGAALQAWALQTYLRKEGYDAELVNYGRIGWPGKYIIRTNSLRSFAGSIVRNVLTFFRTFVIEGYRRRLYRRFLKEDMKIGVPVAKTEINKQDYTHLITGSDQVWHPVINEGDETYFLANAAKEVKRISYAPSFGVDQFESALEVKMSVWLGQFDALSVREPEGAAIINRLCGRDAAVVCDPTLLLPREEYEKIERKPHFGFPEKYIAVYTICGHPWAETAAIELGKRMGLQVVHLPGGQSARWYSAKGNLRRVTALGPAEWIWMMHHADYVITNSFHGTVFSLLFHKPFTVALNGKASDARMKALLSGTECENQATEQLLDINPDLVIDWNVVDRELSRKARTGKEFLNQNLI